MKILIIGNGGREHALGWSLTQDKRVKKIWFAPGNAGTEQLGENLPIQSANIETLGAWAKQHQPDLTLVGPETPLCLGIVDHFETLGLKIFGPNKKAAQLEGSKIFTKRLLLQAGIPTAKSERFSDSRAARDYLRAQPFPQVIKADGLASGKGVIIAQSATEADRAIDDLMERKIFGAAGDAVLIEEFLDGQEMSVHAVTDGDTFRLLPSAQDHKRVFDDDRGPNTGGMGAYAPSPLFTPTMRKQIEASVFAPLLKILKKENIDYRGVLYAGLMITATGPKVLEFNCRFGDPETQVLSPLLETPLLDILFAVVERRLEKLELRIKDTCALTVVLAAAGYPEKPVFGEEITGLDEANGLVFHAGTKRANGRLLTAGGRVLSVTGEGKTLREAYDAVYRLVPHIHFKGMHFRNDIGGKALK
ncbi:MAG: phosphoribosylamine--glycine ligase [bacterium]